MTELKAIDRSTMGGEYDASPSAASRFFRIATPAWFAQRLEKQHSRKALFEISDESLKDIGVSRLAAAREARRRFWD